VLESGARSRRDADDGREDELVRPLAELEVAVDVAVDGVERVGVPEAAQVEAPLEDGAGLVEQVLVGRRAVFLVGDGDDGEDRVVADEGPAVDDAAVRGLVVGPPEAAPAQELRRIEVAGRPHRRAPRADRLEDRLELLLEAAAVGAHLGHAAELVAEVLGRRREHHRILGRGEVQEGRVVRQAVGVRRVAGHGAEHAVLAVLGVGAGVHGQPEDADVARDDADVEVVDAVEVVGPVEVAVEVEVARGEDPDHLREVEGQDLLLLPHGAGVVDEEQHVDPVDVVDLDRLGDRRLRTRVHRAALPLEAPQGEETEEQRGRRRHPQPGHRRGVLRRSHHSSKLTGGRTYRRTLFVFDPGARGKPSHLRGGVGDHGRVRGLSR
jgi:hypothetical protein